MADPLPHTDLPDFREVDHLMTSLPGVNLGKVSKANVRTWENRGSPLYHLAANMDEELKVMTAVRASRLSQSKKLISHTIQVVALVRPHAHGLLNVSGYQLTGRRTGAATLIPAIGMIPIDTDDHA